MDKDEIITICEEILAYDFDDPSLLVQALTHTSGAETPSESNERLEFLGDAVLGYVICELLFKKYPNRDEGELTKIKSAAVSRETCFRIAENLKLQEVIQIGRGVGRNEKIPPSILSNAVEAIIAALYLDGGIKIARRFILQQFSSEILKLADSITLDNYKSVLQAMSQKEFGLIPEYLILDEQGPAHCKCFKISVKIEDQYFPPAWGNSKKTAEQRAAENALCYLQNEEIPYGCE
jgi:ribonuclease-3